VYVAERKRNPFVRSARGGRALSALQLPWFTLLPPVGYGVLTTRGRRTGKTRRKCIRVIRRGDRAFVVSIRPRTAWLRNLQADANVRLRVRGGTFAGVAREPRDDAEREEARTAYCGTVNVVDYLACSLHRRGRPTRAKVQELHRTWFEQGVPVVVELEGRRRYMPTRS
jgi:deazaflavin-dependent oxidoreductase (nitroreductase family)